MFIKHAKHVFDNILDTTGTLNCRSEHIYTETNIDKYLNKIEKL